MTGGDRTTALHATTPAPAPKAGVRRTVAIPQHACWWPITGASSLYVESDVGDLYRVPDTHDTVPRDYDHALSIPPGDQMAIVGGNDKAWPSMIDPKCVVVVRVRGLPHSTSHARYTYWFVRLSFTPQILRRVPPSVRIRLRTSLLQCAAFTQSTLITEYMDTGTELNPELQGWVQYDGREAVSSPPRAPASASRAPALPETPPSMCLICTARPVQRVLVPCGHAVLCSTCGSTWVWRRCPVCRAYVQHVNPLFPM